MFNLYGIHNLFIVWFNIFFCSLCFNGPNSFNQSINQMNRSIDYFFSHQKKKKLHFGIQMIMKKLLGFTVFKWKSDLHLKKHEKNMYFFMFIFKMKTSQRLFLPTKFVSAKIVCNKTYKKTSKRIITVFVCNFQFFFYLIFLDRISLFIDCC